jgi:protein-S-isoprenylcysteine O-methyltransferase Ste14
MRILATLEVLLFVATAFGLRTLLHRRLTGSSGFAGLREGAGGLERLAGALLVLVFSLAPVAPWIGRPLWQVGPGLGAVLGALGLALTLAAQHQMGASWRIGVDARARTALVTSGLFAWVRNPIFSAMILSILGLALAVPTPLALALPPALVVALQLQVRLVEEPYLVSAFGEPYRAWAARTGRFVPGVGRLRPRGAD